jgi:hypothetical protein
MELLDLEGSARGDALKDEIEFLFENSQVGLGKFGLLRDYHVAAAERATFAAERKMNIE